MSSLKADFDIDFCPVGAAWTCNTVFATSNGCAKKILVYLHVACSANCFTTSLGDGEESDRYSE